MTNLCLHPLSDPRTGAALLAPADEHQVLVEWNRTDSPYPTDACLHDAFERQAAAHPDAEALVVGHERLTYRELNRRANRIAHHLRSLGVRPETPVGIFLPRTSDLICALLGVLKSGGAYVPLDPTHPIARLSFLLNDAQVHAVLTHASLAASLDGLAASAGPAPTVVCVDTDEGLALAPDTDPPPLARPDHLAYIIYTSGSTGRPKGVCLEHRNVVSFIHWCGELYSSRELSGVVATATVCFDASVLELFTPLSFGGKVILAENALAVPDLPAVNEIHLMDTVPSAIRELLRIGGLPTSLETVNLGGEAVPDDLIRALYQLPHIQRVYDQYGPTETTVVATCSLRDPREPSTIGRPIANTRAYLLNERLEPVAPGEAGELCLGGAGVARGYLNRPELTAKRFIPDPFSRAPGSRLYRTGDLCRYLPDGRLKFIGRADLQVKIRGFRIELGEIETALASLPSVAEAVARAWTAPDDSKKIVAYVVPVAGAAAPTEREIRDYLKTRLPDYMVPTSVVLLDRLPLSPNGKLDAQALPAPSPERPELSSAYAPPVTPLEKSLVAAWKRVLLIDTIGIDDSFLELGGDSLSLARVRRAIAPLTPQKLTMADLFRFATVRALAAFLETPVAKPTAKAPAPLARRNGTVCLANIGSYLVAKLMAFSEAVSPAATVLSVCPHPV